MYDPIRGAGDDVTPRLQLPRTRGTLHVARRAHTSWTPVVFGTCAVSSEPTHIIIPAYQATVYV